MKWSLQKCKLVSERGGATQSKYSISGSSARNTCIISRISRDSWISRWQLTVYGLVIYCKEMQHQCQHHTSHWKSIWQSPECCLVEWQEIGSELRLESDKGVYSYLPSPTFFSISLKRIMFEALYDNEGSVSTGRLITNFRFANGIALNTEEVLMWKC